MTSARKEKWEEISRKLAEFEQLNSAFPGLAQPRLRSVFIDQLVDSIRRVEFPTTFERRPICAERADPRSAQFDPLRAAVAMRLKGDVEEACWLVFLATHCGKHKHDGWKLAADIYGGQDTASTWCWSAVQGDVGAFASWLSHEAPVWAQDSTNRRFGNHRKYESLRPGRLGTGAVVQSYVGWVRSYGTHMDLIRALADSDPGKAFNNIFASMKSVSRFGRTARFDYTCSLGQLGIANVAPASVYMVGATGPRRGARLLLGDSVPKRAADVEVVLADLGGHLGVGMQEMEDALCNWQKNPRTFVHFRG